MIKKMFFVVKKFIIGVLFVYAYNLLVFPLNMTIPLNVFTIIFVTILGIPAVIGFCLFQLFVL